MTNIVDFAKFQKAKKQKPEDPNYDNSSLAIVNDRISYRTRSDNMIELLEGGRVKEVRPATHAEMMMAEHFAFLEATIIDLTLRHEPHRLLDDYLIFPYLEWNDITGQAGEKAIEWNRTFTDEANVPMKREAHLLLKDIRAMAAMLGFTNKIGFMSIEPNDLGKLVYSATSPFVFRINSVADIAGTSLCVTFKLKDGCTDPAGVLSGEIFIPEFWAKQERVTFMALLFTAPSSHEFLQQAESLILVAKDGHVRIEK
jgi:hypothetical protein